ICFTPWCHGQNLSLDASLVLNRHADQVGIWVNPIHDQNNVGLLRALRQLRLKSIRYGWQCGLFDPRDLTSQMHSPRDPDNNGHLIDGKGRMRETFGPGGVAELMDATATTGFAVVHTDGVIYNGSADQRIAKMPEESRIDAYAGRAAMWASWAKGNRFEYFEIGNENDIVSPEKTNRAFAKWSPELYARVARKFLTEIKRANPNAKCGINGGLLPADESIAWFSGIFDAEPSLADDLDFTIAHKYEMWLDYKTWLRHPDWDLGRLSKEYREIRAERFPGLPVQVTEIGPWKPGENDQHYRALLATEMLGNVRMDAAVQHAQFWPTRWYNEGIFKGTNSQLSPMGLGLAAYTQFAHPILFANGYSGNVRYFAARGDTAATFWFVNHSEEAGSVAVAVKNLETVRAAERWSLQSPSNDPTATDTQLVRLSSPTVSPRGDDQVFQVDLAPLSVTIVQVQYEARKIRPKK
ncbi:MAG: hypothetical protein AAFU85_03650, partial [Planctomycetota bacterium]